MTFLILAGTLMLATVLMVRPALVSGPPLVLQGFNGAGVVLGFACFVAMAVVMDTVSAMVMAAAIAWFMLRQVLTSRMALALVIGGVGALWVIFRADLGALMAFDVGRGEAIYFVGCVSHAIYTPLVRRLNRGEGPVTFTFGTLLAGAVLLLVYAWGDIAATDWTGLPPLVWITLVYVTICATSITVVLLSFATLRLPSAKVMAYTYLTPTWVIVWEIFLGKGVPSVFVLGGVGLTILALLLLLRDDTAKNI